MAKTAPKVEFTDRRIQERLRNPFGSPSGEIQWKDKSRIGRWFNQDIYDDKIWQAKNKGWNLTMPEDIEDLDQIGGFKRATAGGHIVRGEREKEVLCWMRKEDFEAIQLAKTRLNNRNMGNPAAQLNEVVEAAGRQLGDEAADFLNRTGRISGGVVDRRERIVQTPDGE